MERATVQKGAVSRKVLITEQLGLARPHQLQTEEIPHYVDEYKIEDIGVNAVTRDRYAKSR